MSVKTEITLWLIVIGSSEFIVIYLLLRLRSKFDVMQRKCNILEKTREKKLEGEDK